MSLWPLVQGATARARASGHLCPIPTTTRWLHDGGIDFLVRVVEGQFDKPAGVLEGDRADRPNPFLPYDHELFVADISDTHIALLNKFVVVDHHLLIVTREFQSQTDPAHPSDFIALARCLWEYPSVAFYNAGKTAGASQPHRHWQLIPLPLDGRLTKLPIEEKLPIDSAPVGQVVQVAELPFAHRWWKFTPDTADSAERFAQGCEEAYESLVRDVGWSRVDGRTPYNLLITRRWLMLIPRREEYFAHSSLNAMAFLGAILVRGESQFQQLAAAGPLRALAVAAPRHVSLEASHAKAQRHKDGLP